jgi:uncharacterized membrane protein (DUF4010 family)
VGVLAYWVTGVGVISFYVFVKKKKIGSSESTCQTRLLAEFGGSTCQTRKFTGFKQVDPIKTRTRLAQTHYLFFRVVFAGCVKIVGPNYTTHTCVLCHTMQLVLLVFYMHSFISLIIILLINTRFHKK